MPSDIGAQLDNTFPALNFTAATIPTDVSSPLSLSDLALLNAIGNCTDFDTCPIYLTSKDNVTANPPWLYGVLPDPVTFETVNARSCAIIVNDHGKGLVDAFYMYFYAFNMGETVFGQVLGDHVGDWEHSMVRFVNGTPSAVWLSQHDVSPSRERSVNRRLMSNSTARHSHTIASRRMAPGPSYTAPSAHTPTLPSQACTREKSPACKSMTPPLQARCGIPRSQHTTTLTLLPLPPTAPSFHQITRRRCPGFTSWVAGAMSNTQTAILDR